MEEQGNALSEQDMSNDDNNENSNVEMVEAEGQEAPEAEGNADKEDPYGVKKRLGMQAKKHQREMRQMQDQMARMEAMLGSGANPQHYPESNPYPSPGQPSAMPMTEQDRIQQAVHMALGAREAEEQKKKDAEKMAHVQKQYQRLQNEFNKASDKYEDFDEVVRGDDVPFTQHVRDALLLVENPAEVAYRLGKNVSELERIAKLHPLDQAREVNKLAFSLMGGSNNKNSGSSHNPLVVKANPALSSSAINGKTPASVIRARMKSGDWK